MSFAFQKRAPHQCSLRRLLEVFLCQQFVELFARLHSPRLYFFESTVIAGLGGFQVKKVVIGLLFGAFLSGCKFGPGGAAADAGAPEFNLQRIAGGNLSSQDLKGKIAVIDFWATWCDPCKEEIPAYNKLADSIPEGSL